MPGEESVDPEQPSSELGAVGQGSEFNHKALAILPRVLQDANERGLAASAVETSRRLVRLAREEGQIQPVLTGLFWLVNRTQDTFQSELGVESSIELISLLESEERARLIEPNLDPNEYAETVAWMTSCAYDNLAEHTARRNGFNSPGMQACINSGIEVCRRVGNSHCVACFRQYAIDVYRAGDDLDMALHCARQVVEIPANSPTAFRRAAGARHEGDILLLRGLLEPARQAYERARHLKLEGKHQPHELLPYTLREEVLELLAGRLPPELEPLSLRQIKRGENPSLDFDFDLRDALVHALREEWEEAEKLLVPWDRRLRNEVKELWFEIRLRLMAIDRLRGNLKRFERLAEDTRAVALEACDWLTISRIDALSSPDWRPSPYPSLAPLGVPTRPQVETKPETKAETSTETPTETPTENATDSVAGNVATDAAESVSGADGELGAVSSVGPSAPVPTAEDEIPETPLKERLSQLADRLPLGIDTPAEAASIAYSLLKIEPETVAHPYDAGWMLHLMTHVADQAADQAAVSRWAYAVYQRYPNDGRVISTFATLAHRFHKENWPVPGRLDRDAIEALFRRSLDLDPTRSRNFARAAQFYVDHDNFAEAERCLARSFRLDRTSPLVVSQLAELYEHNQRPRDALAVLDLALRAGCREPQICWKAAMLAFSLDQFEALKTYLGRYEELRPGEPWTNHYRALALYELGDFAAAREAIDDEMARNGDQPAGSLALRVCIASRLEEPDRVEEDLTSLLAIPLREISYLTAQGFTGLYGRLWRATRPMTLGHPLRRQLHDLLLQSGLAPDDLFEEIAATRRPGNVSLYRVVLRQPLDERWKNSPGCLPGQEEWSNYDAIWGVLAESEEEAARLARRMQFRCYPLANELISVESSKEEFADFSRVVWQGMRYVEELPEELGRFLAELSEEEGDGDDDGDGDGDGDGGLGDDGDDFSNGPGDSPDRPGE
jgi:Tfp pilus assembly protein PilF